MLLFRIISTSFILFFSISIFAQNPNFRFIRYGVEHGLSQGFIHSIKKDKQGFLWIATQDGVNRFDGTSFKVFKKGALPHALPWAHIRDIAEDTITNNLWLASSDRGLVIYNQNQNNFESALAKNSLPLVSEFITHLSLSGKHVWVSTLKGISVIDRFTKKVIQNFPINTTFRQIVPVSNNEMWAFSRKGKVYQINQTSVILKDSFYLPDIIGQEIKDVWRVFQSGGNTWVCTRDGLFKSPIATKTNAIYFARQKIITDKGQDFSNSFIRCALQDSQNNLWIGVDSIGLLYKTALDEKFILLNGNSENRWSISDNYITQVYEDKNGCIWVSTEKGFNRLIQKQPFFTTIGTEADTHLQRLDRLFAVASLGNDIVLSSKNITSVFHPAIHQFSSINNHSSVSDLKVRFLQAIDKDSLWAGGVNGLFILYKKGQSYYLINPPYPELEKISGYPIRTMLWINKDTCLMGGNGDNGLILWDKKNNDINIIKKDEKNQATSLVDNYISKIIKDKTGACWIATDEGISKFDPLTKRFTSFFYKQGKEEGHFVYDLLHDGKFLWMAFYQEGLAKWDPSSGRLQIFDEKHGLLSSSIYNLRFDVKGNLWMDTNNGISYFNKDKNHFINYTLQDGIQDNEFNNYSVFETDKNILFGGVSGLTMVDKNPQEIYKPFPYITITGMRYNDKEKFKEINFSEEQIRLKYFQNDITFQFAALDFSSNHRIQYTYMLEGYNKNWITNQNTKSVTYTNLDPGKYIFKVKASNNEFVGKPKITSLPIYITPAWYQTLLFKILVVLFSAFVIIMFVRMFFKARLKQQKINFERQLAVQSERQRISAEIHDDIGAGLSGVRLLTELTGKKIENKETQEEVNKIYSSITDLSSKMREVIWSLNTSNDTLENLLLYIQRQAKQLLESSNINLYTDVPDNIPEINIGSEKRTDIYLSVKEALHNALKHSGAEKIELDFAIENNYLYISVCDNGKGIQGNNAGDGNGMLNMKKRMSRLGGTIDIKNNKGTTIHFSVPLK